MAISTPLPVEPERPALGWRGWALVAVAVGVFVGAGVAVSRSSAFHARTIEVTGIGALSRAEVVRVAGISRSTNVPWLDEAAAERRLASRAWVDSAVITTELPWTIRIHVVERRPVALIDDGVRRLLIAPDGTILGPARGPRGLPVIELPDPRLSEPASVSPAAGAAAALGAMGEDLRSEIRRVRPLGDGTLELVLSDGLLVRFGRPTDLERKADSLARITAWARAQGVTIRVVTVIAPRAPTVVLAG